MSTLEILEPTNWEDFLLAPVSMLMLGKNGCGACEQWTETLNDFLDLDQEFNGIRFGKISLDKPGFGRFKLSNEWIKEVDILPFNCIFINGERVEKWAGGGLPRMQTRLRGFLEG